MKRLFLIAAFVLLSLSGLVSVNAQRPAFDADTRYPVSELKEDLKYFRSKLEKVHPALYMYTPKEHMDHLLDSLSDAITHPLSSNEFYSQITLINSAIKDGHTLLLPGTGETAYHLKNSLFLPIDIVVRNAHLFVAMNCSSQKGIEIGDEIESINDVPADHLLDEMVKRQSRDGNNTSYAYWIFDKYFRSYFSFFYGHPETYSMRFKHKDSAYAFTVKGLTIDSIEMNRSRYYKEKDISVGSARGIWLEMNLDNPRVAYLKIPSFDKDILKIKYKQEFAYTIDSCLNVIKKEYINKLVLDLRDNQGGDFKNGIHLLWRLLNEEAVFLPGSPQERLLYPKMDRYKGELYVMINGGSFSMSSIVSSYLAATKRAVFIGSESGGNRTVICGEPRSFTLPNTKIHAEISSVLFPIIKRENDGRGNCVYWGIKETTYPGFRDTMKKTTLEMLIKVDIGPEHFCSD